MILRLNKKVMAILSFWTILSLQVPIIKNGFPEEPLDHVQMQKKNYMVSYIS